VVRSIRIHKVINSRSIFIEVELRDYLDLKCKGLEKVLFSSNFFCKISTVVFLFVFDKYCLTMN